MGSSSAPTSTAILVATQFNLSVPQFEQELRNELTLRKLRAVIGAGVFVSNAEVHDAFIKAEDQGQVRLRGAERCRPGKIGHG